jgi:hypothetical protein
VTQEQLLEKALEQSASEYGSSHPFAQSDALDFTLWQHVGYTLGAELVLVVAVLLLLCYRRWCW